MRRLAFLAAVAALAIVASTAHAAAEKRCGDITNDPDTAQDVRALGVSCATARSIARTHFRSVRRDGKCNLGNPSCTIRGYTCRRTPFGNSGNRIRCTSGPKRVRFFYGV